MPRNIPVTIDGAEYPSRIAAARAIGVSPQSISRAVVDGRLGTVGKTCAVPYCNSVLGPTNLSGVCQTHRHKMPHCKCEACRLREIRDGDVVFHTRETKIGKCTVSSGGDNLEAIERLHVLMHGFCKGQC